MVEKAMSVAEMGKLLGISRSKSYELAKSKGFPAVRIGKRIVIPMSFFEDWLKKSIESKNEREK